MSAASGHASTMDPGRESYLAQDRSTTTLVSTWSVTGAAFIVALARLYVRAIMRHNVRSDDYFIVLSVAASIASCALTSLAVAHGLGRHTEALSREDQVAVTTWTYIAFCPGVMSFAIPKLAVIALLVRLLVPRRSHYLLLWGMGITVQLTLLATVGILIRVIDEKCPPFNDTRLDPPEHCVPIHVQVKWCLFAGSLSAFVDFYLAIYPSVVLYRLQMRRRKKIALSVALGLGVLSGAVAVYKTTHLTALADPDFTWANANLQTWTVAEGSTIVIAASIPILQPLMERACGVNCIECRRAPRPGPQRQRRLGRDGRRGRPQQSQPSQQPRRQQQPAALRELMPTTTTDGDIASLPPRQVNEFLQASTSVVVRQK